MTFSLSNRTKNYVCFSFKYNLKLNKTNFFWNHLYALIVLKTITYVFSHVYILNFDLLVVLLRSRKKNYVKQN